MAKGGRRPGAGRKEGTPNKLSGTAKENVLAVFLRLGGIDAMVKWGKENPTDFYRLYARLIPQQIDVEANVRVCDVSDTPLTPDEWQKKFGGMPL